MSTRFPCITNAASILVTTVASSTVFFHLVEGALGFVVLIFSAVTAVFTALISVRRWYRGFKLEKLHKRMTRRM
jgi:hypothetical protein